MPSADRSEIPRAARLENCLSCWSTAAARGAEMIRTGEEYRAGLRDGREVWIDGERVADVTAHLAFKPIVAAEKPLDRG
jgi:hypothetical protein